MLEKLLQSKTLSTYTPMQHSLLNTLCQSILAIPTNESLCLSEEQTNMYYPLLTTPHYGIQQAAFHVILNHLRNNVGHPLSTTIPKPLFELIDSDSVFSSAAQKKKHHDEEIEETGYMYRSEMVEFVSFGLAWILMCEFYVKRDNSGRRELSGTLRKEIPMLLGFVFEYMQMQAPETVPNLEFNIRGFDPLSSESVDHFICDLYLIALSTFPSLVRDWWCSDCNRNLTNFVEQFTTKYISPTLIKQEIQIIQNFKHSYENFEVSGNSQIKQVKAFYEEDEVQLGSK